LGLGRHREREDGVRREPRAAERAAVPRPDLIDEDVWGPRIEDRILGGLFRGIDVEVSQVAA
jgi:hypothetical protein